MQQRGRKKNSFRKERAQSEFEQRIIDLARVTRVMAGGKRLRFRACVAIGDKRGRVGWSVAKGADVAIAVNKAVNKAKKNLFKLKLTGGTIPHQVVGKFKSSQVMLKPAVEGTGIIAGGAVRQILELAGVPNIYGKILTKTNNKISNIEATMKALKSLKQPVERDEAVSEEIPEQEEVRKERDLEAEEELEKTQAKILKKEGIEEDKKPLKKD
ncbi:MAG TPA: 30S ribosomal protein S5 [Patescibacteria group bacterium]|nr:30S ribosomal protein S5 [Patescibacteria group bacterium]